MPLWFPFFRVWLLRIGFPSGVLLLTWAHPPLLVLCSKEKFSHPCLAAGTLGTSPRTLIQTRRKALLSTAAQAAFLRTILIHKAAATKWANTSPKSWRSKRHQYSSCSVSLLGLWAVLSVWHQYTFVENMLKMTSFASVRVGNHHMGFLNDWFCHKWHGHSNQISAECISYSHAWIAISILIIKEM